MNKNNKNKELNNTDKKLHISDIMNSILVNLIKEVYQRGYDDGHAEMYNAEFVGGGQIKLLEIEGIEQVVQDVIKKYCSMAEEMITIPKWKFKTIENALRLSHRINNCSTKETAFDREVVKAYYYAKSALVEPSRLPQAHELLPHVSEMLPTDYIDAEMIKRWHAKLTELGEKEMRQDIEAMAKAYDWEKNIKWE
jgi:hypothetical protein